MKSGSIKHLIAKRKIYRSQDFTKLNVEQQQ